MVLEVAILNIKKGQSEEFLIAFSEAESIIKEMKGYIKHTLKKCIEVDHQFILLVEWERLEDHTIGFRTSEKYKSWKKQLHHFYEPFPKVEHYM